MVLLLKSIHCGRFQLSICYSMTITFRTPSQDVRKSAAVLKKQIEQNLKCKLEDCDNPLTMFTGPGANHLCRDHQLQQREYGGMGRHDRPWTFAREWCCDWCGYSPKEDPWFENPPIPFDDELHKARAMRNTLIADHIERKTDGGGHSKDNIQTLCQNCNAKKTALHKDYQRSRYNDLIEPPK